jgi:23S rRNA (guanosine2251-2'-O)-methyltransferase
MSFNNMVKNMHMVFGFHAVNIQMKIAATDIVNLYFDVQRRDKRMQQLLQKAKTIAVASIPSDSHQLTCLCGTKKHQGIAAEVQERQVVQASLEQLLTSLQVPPLLLVLDGVTDPHNLGACLRVADGAGVHAVIAPKDRAIGINPTVTKVASGAAQTVPFFMVTNLARCLEDLKKRRIWCYGFTDTGGQTLYQTDLRGPIALVMGAEGKGLRRLTMQSCDVLLRIPMQGIVESLNVSVATGVVLYEALRQRS